MTPLRRGAAAALLLPALVAGGLTGTSSPAAAADSGVVQIQVLSGRADLVTGEDALLQVDVPADADLADVTVTVADRDVTADLAPYDGGLAGLVTGLSVGDNPVEAVLSDGRGARLTLRDSPLGGPVFSGPQVQPWACGNGSTDSQCAEPTTYDFFYESVLGGPLQAYDPANPAPDVATTTNDQGRTVPFIVRRENGVSLRDRYAIAVLYDPSKPFTATAPQDGYNHKLVLTHGASCDTAYEMGDAPDVLLTDALSRGFAVASHALDNAGHNCNLATEAESLVVTKELVAEHYGPIRYTIGSGCSGGSLVQQQVANAYPGVYQGISPQCSFTDAWSSAQQYVDYTLLRHYFETPGVADPAVLPLSPALISAAYGHPNLANPITFTTAIPNSGDPSRSCPGVPADQVFTTESQTGVRCTLQDYMVNVFGRRADGKANRPYDNVGIQYALAGLQDGTVTPEQFVDLNTKIGGYDIDLENQAERSEADPLGLQRVFTSGSVDTGAHLDQVAIIDLRGPDPGAFHDVYRTYSMRDRLVREHGTSANQVLWQGPVPLLGSTAYVDQAIVALDSWLAVVEEDDRDVPLAQKVLDARQQAGVVDRCATADGTDDPTGASCAGVAATVFSSPRIEAGGGADAVGYADDTLKCQLVPVSSFDYGGRLSPAQVEQLAAAFPTGVCDYSKPSVAKTDAITWQSYDVDGGRPLGAAPVSVPFGPGTAAALCDPAPVSGLADRDEAREVHRRNVDCVLYYGIARGTSATTYGPLRPVTREQMASFLVGTLAASGHALPQASGPDAFSDVATSFHRDSIDRLAAAGIVLGRADGTYGPQDTVTRAEMASFVVRTARVATGQPYGAPGTSPFTDVPAGDVHAADIAAGQAAGLFRGTTATTFSPRTTVVRDQMASFLVELLGQSLTG